MVWDGEVISQAWYVRVRESDLARVWRGSEEEELFFFVLVYFLLLLKSLNWL